MVNDNHHKSAKTFNLRDILVKLVVVCSTCLIDLSSEHFYFRSKERGTLKKICKNCHSLYRREHYLRNRQKYDIAHRWNEKQKFLLREYIYQRLLQSECVDCGEKDLMVLEFDHIQDKKFSITQMYRNSCSLDSVKKEMEKCVIRCANCHRRKTASQFSFWRMRMNQS